MEERVLEAVQHEAGDVLDHGRFLVGGVDQVADRGNGLGGGALVRDDLHAGDERRRVGEVHTQETLRVGHGLGEFGDGDGGGVGADDGVRTGGGADAGQGLVLDRDDLGHCLLDEVGVGNGFLDVLRGPEVLLQDLGGPFGEQAVRHKLVRLGEQAFVVLLCHLGGHVSEGNAGPAKGEDLGNAAAHVAGSDDGELR